MTIVYESATGFTKKYAEMLREETGLPCLSLSEAEQTLPADEEILFLGYVFKRKIQGAEKAAKRFRVKAVLAVGINRPRESAADYLRRESRLPEDVPVFMALGGIDRQKITGLKKMMLTAMTRGLEKGFKKSEEDKAMLDLLLYGGDWSSREQLAPILEWYKEQRGMPELTP